MFPFIIIHPHKAAQGNAWYSKIAKKGGNGDSKHESVDLDTEPRDMKEVCMRHSIAVTYLGHAYDGCVLLCSRGQCRSPVGEHPVVSNGDTSRDTV